MVQQASLETTNDPYILADRWSRSPLRKWFPAPYVPNSIVVNIGDLMSLVSDHKFKATYHGVRSSPGKSRYSVPFFFEPGAGCLVKSICDSEDKGVLYGKHVLEKMSEWVEFQDVQLKNEEIMVRETVEEVGILAA